MTIYARYVPLVVIPNVLVVVVDVWVVLIQSHRNMVHHVVGVVQHVLVHV